MITSFNLIVACPPHCLLDDSLQLGWGSSGHAGHREFGVFEGVRPDLLDHVEALRCVFRVGSHCGYYQFRWKEKQSGWGWQARPLKEVECTHSRSPIRQPTSTDPAQLAGPCKVSQRSNLAERERLGENDSEQPGCYQYISPVFVIGSSVVSVPCNCHYYGRYSLDVVVVIEETCKSRWEYWGCGIGCSRVRVLDLQAPSLPPRSSPLVQQSSYLE